MKTEAVFLGFGFVSAQSQGCFEPVPSPKPCQNPKILAPNGHNISLKALKILSWLGDLQICRAAGAGVLCHAGWEFGGVDGHALVRHLQGLGLHGDDTQAVGTGLELRRAVGAGKPGAAGQYLLFSRGADGF